MLGNEKNLYEIDWRQLKNELRQWKFWQNRTLKSVILKFFIAMLLLGMSSFDVFGDSKLAGSYVGGTKYTKWTTNQTLAESQNCTWIGATIRWAIYENIL